MFQNALKCSRMFQNILEHKNVLEHSRMTMTKTMTKTRTNSRTKTMTKIMTKTKTNFLLFLTKIKTKKDSDSFHLKLQISLKNNLQNVQDISEHFLILWTKTLTKTKTRTNNLSLGLDSNSSLMELDAADLHLVFIYFQLRQRLKEQLCPSVSKSVCPQYV